MKRMGVVGFILLLLTSCGFHLRGIVNMPPWLNNVAIIIEQAHRDLCPQLKEQLESYKVYTTDPAQAQYWLIIEHDQFQQEITSISSSTTPRQYQLIYKVWFKLCEKQGKEIIPLGKATVIRQATINGDRILGSNDEEAIIKAEMIREAVIQIINRLNHPVINHL